VYNRDCFPEVDDVDWLLTNIYLELLKNKDEAESSFIIEKNEEH
jgi:hypothetical protein